MPVLRMLPLHGSCEVGGGRQVRCLLVRAEDWDALVLYAKTLCLAAGQSPAACQAE